MAKFIEKNHYFILTIIFLTAFLLRGVELLSGNYLFGFDQGRDYLLVKEMVEGGKPRLIGAEVGAGSAGISHLFHGPFYLYFLSLFYLLFAGDPYGGIVMVFLFGMVALFATYSVGKRILGAKTALLLTFLVSISPNIAPQSRFLWNHHPTSFFIVIAFYFIFLIPENPLVFLPLSLFTAGFIYNFQLAIAVPLTIAIIIYSLLMLKIRKPKVLLFSAFALIIAFSPFLVFEVRHGFNAVRGTMQYITNSSEALNIWSEYSMLKNHIYDYWNNFMSTFSFFMVIKNFYLHILFVILLIFGLTKTGSVLKSNSQKQFLRFVIILIIFTWLFFLLLKNNIWDYYLVHLHFAYIFLFSIVFARFIKEKNWFLIGIFSLYLFSMMIWSGIRIYQNYKDDYFDFGGGAKIKGKLQAIDYIYHDANGEKFNVLVFMPPIYTYPYDYLFWWHGQKKYSYVPGSEKKGLFYLLIEPDGAKPWSYKGWQETVIKTGKVIWTKELSSGLIVEKRYEEAKN